MIDVRSVSLSYGSSRVLDDVSLTIPAGGVTSVIGPNGAGKSTLLSVISRLQAADSGSVRVKGMDVSTTPSGQLAKTLAILRQENHVTLRLTVEDLVLFGRYPHTKGRPGTEDRQIAADAIAEVGLQDLRLRTLDELSGGQRQRAYIAMVLAQDAECILLDEPLNNLDLKHSLAIMRLARRLADERGKTIVVVIHDINVAACHSDTLVAMKDGRVVAQGGPQEIMQPDLLEQVFDTEIEVREIDGHPIALCF